MAKIESTTKNDHYIKWLSECIELKNRRINAINIRIKPKLIYDIESNLGNNIFFQPVMPKTLQASNRADTVEENDRE